MDKPYVIPTMEEFLSGKTEQLEEEEEGVNEEEERVYYAITGEDVVTLKHLLEDGLDPNVKFHGSNQLDKSALHLCCETGNYECAKVLLEHGAKVNVVDAWVQTPLIYSISSQRNNMIDLMIKFRCDINIKDRFGRMSLHFALDNNDTTPFRAVLAAGADVNAMDVTGRTPLWSAVAEDGRNEHLSLLLAAPGCDVNTRDHREKRTPLQVAILYSNRDTVSYVQQLLAAGAQCNTVDQFGHSPMMTLIRRNRRKDKEEVREEDLTIARMLLQYSYDVDLISPGTSWYQYRGTALKMAVDRCALPLVQLLLEAGADPDLPDDKNVTPLLVAASHSAMDVVKHLIMANCRLDTQGEMKIDRQSLVLTPFLCTLHKANLDMCKLLVLAGYTLRHEEYLHNRQARGDSSDSSDSLIEMPSVLQLPENSEFYAWLVEQATVPRSLAEQSRSRIRQLLGKTLRLSIEKLPFPRAIKDYVLMKDLLE